MSLDWLVPGGAPQFNLAVGLPGLLTLVVYAALTLNLAMRHRREILTLSARRAILIAALLALAPILARTLVLSFQLPDSEVRAAVPLLVALAPVVGAVWGGPLVGLLVGLASGLTVAAFDTHRLTQPFEMALAAASIALLIHQPYRGRVGAWLRQPLIATLLGSLFVGWPLQLLGSFMTDYSSALDSLDRAASSFAPTLAASIIAASITGLLVQAVVMRWPRLNPMAAIQLETAPWQRRLNTRVFSAFFPVACLAALILVSTVAFTSYVLATNLVVDQMGRNAANAGSSIPFFTQEGRSLIRNLAQDERLLADSSDLRQARLQDSLTSVAFFEQLVLFDSQQHLINAYPEQGAGSLTLSAGEESRVRLALAGGAPTEVITHTSEGTFVTFVAAITQPSGGAIRGAVLGRTALRDNPAMSPVLGVLRQGVVGSGEGFVIDNQNRIVLYPARPELEQTDFVLGAAVVLPGSGAGGQAFRQTQADGSRRLITILPVASQSDWSIVLVEPNRVALTLAVQIALPTLGLLLIMMAVAAPAVIAITRSITSPLDELVKSADRIAQGQLDRPVQLAGEDEIGQLGQAFEQMRLRLKNRLDEQDRLLQVSRAVSSNLELFRAMPPILSSALDVTQAASVRVALRRGGDPLQTYAAGHIAAGMAALDETLIDLVEKQGTVIISQISRASGSLDVSRLPSTVQSLAALPLRSDTSFYGVLWLTYDHEHIFEQSELTFLATLTGQAAVAVANARLLAEAEEGRRKLEAVLESTSDGLIAVDNHGKVLLMNPAAEKYFGVRFEQARGRIAEEIVDVRELAILLTNLQEPTMPLELPGRNGATLLANTSTMVSHDGTLTGRVTLLRDISALKELDNIKTVFLRMVSHDLRSPLTYMRGYLSMLPLSGDLNATQLESIDKINSGIQHITEMTERLLYLSRLKFGDEAELELSLVDVKELLEEIQAEQSGAAKDNNITLKIQVAERLPLLLVDGMLLHQAITNLITNAVKYTPDGGEVTVRAVTEMPGTVTVGVADTGIGIRPEDQKRLFEAFYRVPQREGEPARPHGTGLGLALVKAIAEAHNGSVWVESAFGAGSKFYISIPVRKPQDL